MPAVVHHPALAEITRLFDARGALAYGEAVDQRAHALQCGALAIAEGAPATLVLAAVLHDIGHMIHKDAARALAGGADDMHEVLGANYLSRWFVPAVSEPVRLHVEAKRYLCAREPAYRDGLSAISRRTLEIQGGPMNSFEAAAFEALPHAQDAVALRRWDDAGKRAGASAPPLEHFLAMATDCLREA